MTGLSENIQMEKKMAARKTTEKEQTFEEALGELEAIVAEMEQGEPTLVELTEKYSRGVMLVDKCQQELDRAEKMIDMMVKSDGSLVETDMTTLRV